MRFRVSVRVVMVLVAIIAIVAGPGYRWVSVMRERSRRYQNNAEFHELSRQLMQSESQMFGAVDDASKQSAAKQAEAWHAKQRDLYKAAAQRPWTTIPQGELEPDF